MLAASVAALEIILGMLLRMRCRVFFSRPTAVRACDVVKSDFCNCCATRSQFVNISAQTTNPMNVFDFCICLLRLLMLPCQDGRAFFSAATLTSVFLTSTKFSSRILIDDPEQSILSDKGSGVDGPSHLQQTLTRTTGGDLQRSPVSHFHKTKSSVSLIVPTVLDNS